MATATKKVDAWFDWEGDDDSAKARFVLLTEQDYAAIDEKSEELYQHFNTDTQKVESKLTTFSAEKRRLIATKATKGWSGFFDQNREPMECTKGNIEFWSCNSGFMEFLWSCQVKLRATAKEQEDAARKNL